MDHLEKAMPPGLHLQVLTEHESVMAATQIQVKLLESLVPADKLKKIRAASRSTGLRSIPRTRHQESS